MRPWERAAILLALVLQAIALYGGIAGNGGIKFSFSYALSLTLWLAVLIYWLESYNNRMDGLQPLVLPIAAICSALTALFPKAHAINHADTWFFRGHFLAAMLAYGFVTLSALHAIFMGFIERQLHHKILHKQLAGLPPLMAMDNLLFRTILIAFGLLTLTLGSGMLFSETVADKPVALDNKTLFGFAAWGIFAGLLIGRHIYGWRGRIALRWTLAGFLLLLLAYVGSSFVSEVILGSI